MIIELQSAEHFDPINLWMAAHVFPMYSAERFQQRKENGSISVAAVQRAQAQSAVFWADQLMDAFKSGSTNPYRDGFICTSKVEGCLGSAVWGVSPFVMAGCLLKTPPSDSDFDYTDTAYVSGRLAFALPKSKKSLRPIYDPNCLDIELVDMLLSDEDIAAFESK